MAEINETNVVQLDAFREKSGSDAKAQKIPYDSWTDLVNFAAKGGPTATTAPQKRGPVLLKPDERMTSQGFIIGTKEDRDGIALMGLDID